MLITSKFNGRCVTCGRTFKAGTTIEWARDAGATHATPADCETARRIPEVAAEWANLTPIADFLKAARERGLKYPKLRILDLDGRTELRLGLTLVGRAPGSVTVKRVVPNSLSGEYLGLVRPDGKVTGSITSGLTAYLLEVALDPAKAAKNYAALMCRCSFCGLALTDEGSVEVGYGPICAKHWGLPHTPRGTRPLTRGSERNESAPSYV